MTCFRILWVFSLPLLVTGQNWATSHRSFFQLEPAPMSPGEINQGPSRGLTDFTDDEIAAIVDRHNHHRRGTTPEGSNLRYMQWDGRLATMSQNWADYCNFEHGGFEPNISPFDSVGQNLYVASEGSVDAESGVVATEKWHDEEEYYDYNYDTCSNVCGHYTQIVWARTYTVGCGRRRCGRVSNVFFNDPSFLIVCNYGPAGNYQGEKPFTLGPRCSDCEKDAGFCFNGLCRDCSGSNFVDGCECNLQCQNCGTLDEITCTCACAPGWDGADCSKQCANHHEWCNTSPGWPGPGFCEFAPEVPRFCREMCGVCSAADPNFKCNGGTGEEQGGNVGPQETECVDSTPDCVYWAEAGHCDGSEWMLENCMKSCNVCPTPAPALCEDSNGDCSYWAGIGECESNPEWMLTNCQLSCQVCSPQGGPDGGNGQGETGGNQGGEIDNGKSEEEGGETSNAPPYCNVEFTSVATINSELYCIQGAKLWRFDRIRKGRLLSPVNGEVTRQTFQKVSIKVKAAFQRRDKVVLIKGDNIWVSSYQSAKDAWLPDDGYPKKIDITYGLPSNPSCAFYDAFEDKSYFLKGAYVWRYDEYRQRVDVTKARAKAFFKGIPKKPSGAFQDENGDTIILSNTDFYRVPYRTKAVTGEPTSFASEFLVDC